MDGLTVSREMIRAGTPRTVQLLGTSVINQGICADHDVVTNGHSAHHLTSGTEIDIVSDRRTTGARGY